MAQQLNAAGRQERNSMLKFSTKIMIVDDHPIVRYGVAKLIDKEVDMEVCAELDGSEDIPRLIEDIQPDVLLLDISLEHVDGIALTRSLRQAGSTLPIIMLSMHDNKVYITRSIRAGANGYVIKTQSSELLIEAIREVRQGRLFIYGDNSEEILKTLTVHHPSERNPPLDLLSDRERQIFIHIGRGYSTVEIGDILGIRPKTVETYRSRIKAKLELDAPHKLSMAAVDWATREGLNASAVS